MSPSAQPQSPEITVKEWVRLGDILWFAVGVAMIATIVWVLTRVAHEGRSAEGRGAMG